MSTLEIDHHGARRARKVTVGRVCIDSGSVDDVVEEMVIRDRRHLSEDGIVLPIIAVNRHTGRMESLPEIVSRGFALAEDGGENAGSLQPRGEDRLGRDQGEDSRGFEAVYREGDLTAAADHAGDFGGMNSGGSGAAADLTVRRSSAASMTRRYQSGPAHTDTCLTALTSSNKWYAPEPLAAVSCDE